MVKYYVTTFSLLPIYFLSSYVHWFVASVANGSCKAGKGDKRISEAISTNGYDCKIKYPL